MVLDHFTEGSQIQTYDFVRKPYKQFLPQVNWHVLFYCTNEVCCTKYYRCYWKALPIERNPFAAKNQTLSQCNTQGCCELILFPIYHWRDIFKMLPILKSNCYVCHKLNFSFVGCRKAKKVRNHCFIELLQSIYFAYEVGIISSYSNRIC